MFSNNINLRHKDSGGAMCIRQEPFLNCPEVQQQDENCINDRVIQKSRATWVDIAANCAEQCYPAFLNLFLDVADQGKRKHSEQFGILRNTGVGRGPGV